MGHTREVHDLLYRAFGQHGEACLARGHHILMVTEDAERMRSDCTGRYVEHARKHFAGYLVHVGDHQKQTLRSRIGRSQSACLQRAVHRTRCAALRLHLLHENRLAEDVLSAGCGPLVDVFCHSRRRGDRVNGRHFRKHVRDVGCCLITVTSQEFLFLTHKSVIYVCLDGYESLFGFVAAQTVRKAHVYAPRSYNFFPKNQHSHPYASRCMRINFSQKTTSAIPSAKPLHSARYFYSGRSGERNNFVNLRRQLLPRPARHLREE